MRYELQPWLKLTSDQVEAEWVDPKELAHYPLTPPSVALFTKLGYL